MINMQLKLKNKTITERHLENEALFQGQMPRLKMLRKVKHFFVYQLCDLEPLLNLMGSSLANATPSHRV